MKCVFSSMLVTSFFVGFQLGFQIILVQKFKPNRFNYIVEFHSWITCRLLGLQIVAWWFNHLCISLWLRNQYPKQTLRDELLQCCFRLHLCHLSCIQQGIHHFPSRYALSNRFQQQICCLLIHFKMRVFQHHLCHHYILILSAHCCYVPQIYYIIIQLTIHLDFLYLQFQFLLPSMLVFLGYQLTQFM